METRIWNEDPAKWGLWRWWGINIGWPGSLDSKWHLIIEWGLHWKRHPRQPSEWEEEEATTERTLVTDGWLVGRRRCLCLKFIPEFHLITFPALDEDDLPPPPPTGLLHLWIKPQPPPSPAPPTPHIYGLEDSSVSHLIEVLLLPLDSTLTR